MYSKVKLIEIYSNNGEMILKTRRPYVGPFTHLNKYYYPSVSYRVLHDD